MKSSTSTRTKKTLVLSLIIAGMTATSSSVRAELLGYWDFDDAGNTFADTSGKGNDITDAAGTDPVWGATIGFESSGAYDFSADRLIVPIDVNPGGMPAMTWGAWVRTDDINPGLRKILGHDNGGWDRTLGLDNRAPDGSFRYSAFTGDNPVNASGPVEGTPAPINTTDWTFIAASHDQSAQTISVYIDLDASSTSDPLLSFTEPAGFGAGFPTFAIGGIRPDNANEAWDGAIDQVFIYDEVLAPAKVTAIRDRGRREILGIADSDPDIELNTLSLFGDLTGLGSGPGPQTETLTISNIGLTQNLILSNYTISGPNQAFYELVLPAPASVPPLSDVAVQIIFTPPASGGSFQAALEIMSDDLDTPVSTVNLDAIVASDPNMELVQLDPLFGRMSFHALPATVTRTVTVRNTGVVNDLSLTNLVISGADADRYMLNTPASIVGPGEEVDISVTLTPGSVGSFAAVLDIAGDDPDFPTTQVSLDARIVVVAPANLLAFYPFDDAAAPLTDASGVTGDATVGGGTPVHDGAGGFENGCYQFAGTDWLIVPMDINPATIPEITLGAWVRTDSLVPGLRKVMGHDNGAWDRTLGLDIREGDFRYTAFTGTNNNGPVAGTPGPISTEAWTFLAATYDQTNSEVTVYVDQDVATTDDAISRVSEPTLMADGWPTFSIGSIRPDQLSEAWVGCIDNAFVYEGILTDSEIENLRNLGSSAILGPDNFRITSIVRNPDNTVTLTWNSDPSPGTTYKVLFNTNFDTPPSTWPDDEDAVATQGDTTSHTTVNAFPQTRMFFVVVKN